MALRKKDSLDTINSRNGLEAWGLKAFTEAGLEVADSKEVLEAEGLGEEV